MTAYETGTVSEFWGRGSFVHEAGAHPAYFLSSYVLGVRTEGPREARRLVVDPRLGDLDRAEGTTLTEFGPVSVRWRRETKQAVTYEVDNGTTVEALVSVRLPGRGVRVRFALPPGKHSGRLDADGKGITSLCPI
jgi:hypothetical protein